MRLSTIVSEKNNKLPLHPYKRCGGIWFPFVWKWCSGGGVQVLIFTGKRVSILQESGDPCLPEFLKGLKNHFNGKITG
ncbi:hypothetical protein AM500_12220 [Bacillus sp. FJAT-18017]|nr:hypothetical protein AM500_12220 [Bacillus sp. FJAT-18017]